MTLSLKALRQKAVAAKLKTEAEADLKRQGYFKASLIRSYSSGKPSRPLAAFEPTRPKLTTTSAWAHDSWVEANRPKQRGWGKGRSIAASRRRRRRGLSGEVR